VDCPSCGLPMDHGEYVINATALDVALYGLSAQSLWFGSELTGERVQTLRFGEVAPGYRCLGCRTMVIDGPAVPPNKRINPTRRSAGIDWNRSARGLCATRSMD